MPKEDDNWINSILVGAVGLVGLVAASLFMNNTQGNNNTSHPPSMNTKPSNCGCQHSGKKT